VQPECELLRSGNDVPPAPGTYRIQGVVTPSVSSGQVIIPVIDPPEECEEMA